MNDPGEELSWHASCKMDIMVGSRRTLAIDYWHKDSSSLKISITTVRREIFSKLGTPEVKSLPGFFAVIIPSVIIDPKRDVKDLPEWNKGRTSTLKWHYPDWNKCLSFIAPPYTSLRLQNARPHKFQKPQTRRLICNVETR
jgi:hypothetical protein